MSPRGRPLPSPFVALVTYTLRACLPAKRRFAVLAPCLGAVLFGWLATVIDEPEQEAVSAVAEMGLFALILPLTCLIIGDAVLGADVRAGTFQLTWLSPVSFPTIVVSRWLGAWMMALVTLVPAFALGGALSGVDETVGPLALSAAAGSASYLALFVLVGVLVRRSAMWSFVIVFLVENLVGNVLTAIGQISPRWQAQQAFAGLWEGGHTRIWSSQDVLAREGMPDGWSAIARLALIGIVCLGIAAWRVSRMSPTPSDE